jgi:hypothetical protein
MLKKIKPLIGSFRATQRHSAPGAAPPTIHKICWRNATSADQQKLRISEIADTRICGFSAEVSHPVKMIKTPFFGENYY